MEDIKYLIDVNKQNLSYKVTSVKNGIKICECRINSSLDKTTWTISSWYTNKDYLNQGFGKKTLKKTLFEMSKDLGCPIKIEYIWNGANKYVYDWLNQNFGAISKCPISIQKYSNDDDWNSHIYTLNTEKFLKYFELYTL